MSCRRWFAVDLRKDIRAIWRLLRQLHHFLHDVIVAFDVNDVAHARHRVAGSNNARCLFVPDYVADFVLHRMWFKHLIYHNKYIIARYLRIATIN